jgi:hypothetical protein
MRRRTLAVALALFLVARPPLAAQPSPAPAVVPASVTTPVWKRPWFRPVASLLVPGSGQLLADRDRGVVYLATEVWLVARALALAHQGRQARSQFRTLAFDVARRPFTATRTDGPWEYYEAMSHWVESGVYNTSTSGGFQPETDTLTYNGAMWLLARRNYFENPDTAPPVSSPAYQAALAFYQRRAYGDQYRWSWHDARLEMDVYRHTIQVSDQGYREATNYLGAILANHLVSAVDAYILSRLGAHHVLPQLQVTESPQRVWLIWEHSF